MMKKITLLFVFAIVSGSLAIAQSFTAVYTFDSVKTNSGLTDPTAVPTATGMTFGSFSAVGSSFTNSTGAGRFSFDHWPIGAVPNVNVYDSLHGSIDTTKYYTVTVMPSGGFAATLTSMMFSVRRSGTGVRTYAIRSSADGYMSNLPASVVADTNLNVQADSVFYFRYDVSTSSSGYSGSKITLSGTDYTNFVTPLTFRFYAWNAEGTTGTFSIDSVKFMGSVITGTTSIKSVATSAVTVYPNPSTDGMFTLNTGNVSGKTAVTVYNIVGKAIYTSEIVANTKETIDLSNQPNGSYFIAIRNEAGITTKKIIINK
jgi:hypothetical protein